MRYARGPGARSGIGLAGAPACAWWWGAACSWRSALRPPRRDRGWKAIPSRPARPRSTRRRTRCGQYQAALGAAQGKLSAASAELARLQTQAEVLIERYDQAQVNEQRAASAYQVTEARLRQAEQQQAASPGAYRCRPPGGLTEASGPEGLSWLST